MPSTPAGSSPWAAIAQRMITNTEAIALQASRAIDDGVFDQDGWITAATQMFDVAFLGAIELVESVVAGPARPGPSQTWSDPISLGSVESDRTLTIETPLIRLGADDAIPLSLITFELPAANRDPAGRPVGFAPAGVPVTRLVVDIADAPSAVYKGTVRVTSSQGSIHLVPVEIAL